MAANGLRVRAKLTERAIGRLPLRETLGAAAVLTAQRASLLRGHRPHLVRKVLLNVLTDLLHVGSELAKRAVVCALTIHSLAISTLELAELLPLIALNLRRYRLHDLLESALVIVAAILFLCPKRSVAVTKVLCDVLLDDLGIRRTRMHHAVETLTSKLLRIALTSHLLCVTAELLLTLVECFRNVLTDLLWVRAKLTERIKTALRLIARPKLIT